MVRSLRIIGSLSCIVIFANFSSLETTVDGQNKHAVNFYGTLTTKRGKTYKVDNIAIGGRFKDIPFFEAMGTSDSTPKNSKNLSMHKLITDPKEGIITKIDLAEVAEITVVSPTVIWTYQKHAGFKKNEFIEIVITANDDTRSQNTYLIDARRKITCDQTNPEGPTEEIPFGSLSSLKIEGYKQRTVAPQPKTNAKKKSIMHEELATTKAQKNLSPDQENDTAEQTGIIVIDPIT